MELPGPNLHQSNRSEGSARERGVANEEPPPEHRSLNMEPSPSPSVKPSSLLARLSNATIAREPGPSSTVPINPHRSPSSETCRTSSTSYYSRNYDERREPESWLRSSSAEGVTVKRESSPEPTFTLPSGISRKVRLLGTPPPPPSLSKPPEASYSSRRDSESRSPNVLKRSFASTFAESPAPSASSLPPSQHQSLFDSYRPSPSISYSSPPSSSTPIPAPRSASKSQAIDIGNILRLVRPTNHQQIALHPRDMTTNARNGVPGMLLSSRYVVSWARDGGADFIARVPPRYDSFQLNGHLRRVLISGLTCTEHR